MKTKFSKIFMVLIFLFFGACLVACNDNGDDKTLEPTNNPTNNSGEDTEAPVIKVSGASTTETNIVEVLSELTLPTISVTDNVDSNVSVEVSLYYNGQKLEPDYVTGDYYFDELGTYTLKINAKDSSGNQATEVVITYLSSDTTKPVITDIGALYGMAGSNWNVVWPDVNDYCKIDLEAFLLAPNASEYVEITSESVLLTDAGTYKVKYVAYEKRVDGLSNELIVDLIAFDAGYVNNFETDDELSRIIVEQGLLKSMTIEKQNEDLIDGEYSLKVKMTKADEGAKDSWPCIRIPFVNSNITGYDYISFDIYNSGNVDLAIYGCLYNSNNATRGDDSKQYIVAPGQLKTIVLDISLIKGQLSLEDVTGIYLWVPIFSDADREYVLDNVKLTNEAPLVHEFDKVNSAKELLTEVQNGTEHNLYLFYSDSTFKQTVHFGDTVHSIPAGMTETSGQYEWAGGFLKDGEFVQTNLVNDSEVRFTYKAASNCYVVLNLTVETWHPDGGNYVFKILANDLEVYSKTAENGNAVFAKLTNQLVYLQAGEELTLSFSVIVPDGISGNYERSFFIRKHLIEVLLTDNELSTPVGFESLQQYIDLDGVAPTPSPTYDINSVEELLAEVKNGSSTNLLGFYKDETFVNTVSFGESTITIPGGLDGTTSEGGWAGAFVKDVEFIQVNLANQGLNSEVSAVVKLTYTATENCYVVLDLLIETWNPDGGNYVFEVLANNNLVYSKKAENGNAVFVTLTNQVVYLEAGQQLELAFSYVVPAGTTNGYERSFFIRKHVVEILTVEAELSTPEGFESLQLYIELDGVAPTE